MKDDVALLTVAIVCCAGAVLFWRFLGEAGGSILFIIAVASLAWDNIRLRRKLR
jgi:hypothetical protein